MSPADYHPKQQNLCGKPSDSKLAYVAVFLIAVAHHFIISVVATSSPSRAPKPFQETPRVHAVGSTPIGHSRQADSTRAIASRQGLKDPGNTLGGSGVLRDTLEKEPVPAFVVDR
jgi:hypothetical protein